MTNSLIIISAPPQLLRRRSGCSWRPWRINKAKSRDSKTPQGRAESSGNATSHGLAANTLILRNESDAEFPEMINARVDLLQPANTAAPAGACAVTRTHRQAEDKIRPQRAGNILNKIPVLQNEPTDLDLNALDATSYDAVRDFHRTQQTQRTQAPPDSLPRIPLADAHSSRQSRDRKGAVA
jgi:hypothetical protein